MLLCLVLCFEVYQIIEHESRKAPRYIYTNISGFNFTVDPITKKFATLHLTLSNNVIVTVKRNQVGEIRVTVEPPEFVDHGKLYPMHPGKI